MPSLTERLLGSLGVPRSVQALPVDSLGRNFPRKLSQRIFALVPVQPLSPPLRTVAVSARAVELLLTKPWSADVESLAQDTLFAGVFSGSVFPANLRPAAHCYWGTQFGSYAGQLGDGAALLLGEINGYEINLKGTGPTPFSRGFDGRKVLRSSVREFLASEAMAGLGVPTTRAAALVVSGSETVSRDVNYSGRPINEPCAVVSRLARSFFRFGSFESMDVGDSLVIRQLTEFVSDHVLSEPTSSLIDHVVDRTAFMVSEWQSVGFVHGVMNTDNMSILGDTIDYGPFGFIENYDPHFVPNTSDKFGRYAFSEQPQIAAWNCARLHAMLDMHLDDRLKQRIGHNPDLDVVAQFNDRYSVYYSEKMRKKLGLSEVSQGWTNRILSLLEDSAVDFTVTFRQLATLEPGKEEAVLGAIMATFPSLERVQRLSAVRVNKSDIPEIEEFARTRLADLKKAGIDLNAIERWKFHIRRVEQFEKGQEWRTHCEQGWRTFLAELAPLLSDESRKVMKSVNPIYIPRQALIQTSIDKAQNFNDFSEVHALLRLFQDPYVEDSSVDSQLYANPDLANLGVCLSCSS